jgi:DNA-binding response OmpR family regulator
MTSTGKIRKYEREMEIQPARIIALTGLASASARLEAMESGIDDYLTKPVNFGKLLELLPKIES